MENNKKIEVGLGLSKGGIATIVALYVYNAVYQYSNDVQIAQAVSVLAGAGVIAIGKALRRYTKIDLKVI